MAQVSEHRLKLSTHELPPYSSQLAGSPGGIAVTVVRCAARRMNLALEIEFVPWARAQLHAQEGLSDGFFAASQSDARDAYAQLSEVIAPQQWRWYFRVDARLRPGSSEFRRAARVTSFLGANMMDWLIAQGYRTETAPTDTAALLRMLQQGRVDAVLANQLVMEHLLATRSDGTSLQSQLALDKPLGVYLTRRFLAQRPPDFMTRFNAAVLACRPAEEPRGKAAKH